MPTDQTATVKPFTSRVHVGTLLGRIASVRGDHATADVEALFEEVDAAAGRHHWCLGFTVTAAQANALVAELTK
jgi:hypothetical protein